MSCIFRMSASSSGATEAKPALLTSMVMLGSSFSFVSTFARSVSLLRSATMEVICRPLALESLPASALSGSSLRATGNAAHESRERSFGHAVDACARKCSADGGVAANEDNPPPVFHGSSGCLDANEGSAYINGDHTIEVLKAIGIDRSHGENAGVAHEDVQQAKGLRCLGHGGAKLFGRCAVSL